MKKYSVHILEQAHENLKGIVLYKKEYDIPSALLFFDGFYLDVEKLSSFPDRGSNLFDDVKGRIYKHHLIPYIIDQNNLEVIILDIIDPMQHTKAYKYIK